MGEVKISCHCGVSPGLRSKTGLASSHPLRVLLWLPLTLFSEVIVVLKRGKESIPGIHFSIHFAHFRHLLFDISYHFATENGFSSIMLLIRFYSCVARIMTHLKPESLWNNLNVCNNFSGNSLGLFSKYSIILLGKYNSTSSFPGFILFILSLDVIMLVTIPR